MLMSTRVSTIRIKLRT